MGSESLKFSSGRSIGNCRKDAKKYAKEHGVPLNQVLNLVASKNGSAETWARTHERLVQDQHDQSTPPAYVTLGAMAASDIQAVIDQHPITLYGYGPSASDVKSMGYQTALAEGQRRLLEAVNDCRKAEHFLQFVTKRKTVNTNFGSYGLKHRVERFLKVQTNPLENTYVANGAFICAALHLGFEMKVYGDSPNVTFNMSSRSLVFEWARLRARYERNWRVADLRTIARYNWLCTHLNIAQASKWD